MTKTYTKFKYAKEKTNQAEKIFQTPTRQSPVGHFECFSDELLTSWNSVFNLTKGQWMGGKLKKIFNYFIVEWKMKRKWLMSNRVKHSFHVWLWYWRRWFFERNSDKFDVVEKKQLKTEK